MENKSLRNHPNKELRWKEHNDAQCKTLSKSIALLKRARQYVSQNTLISMFNGLVLPYKIQKRAARAITGSNYCMK